MKNTNYTGTDVEYETEEKKKFKITRGTLLLAGIIVIALIIIIAVITSKMNSNNKEVYVESDFLKLEQRMVEETPIYLSQNKIQLSSEPYKIELYKLFIKNGGTIDSSKLKATNVCDGYVLATKKDTEEYKAYIKCGDIYVTEGYKKEEITTTTTTTTLQKDSVKPDILIVGEKEITIYVGNVYKEPGFTATDNIDGDITSNVIISGSIDTNKAGTYTLTYSIKDSSGNENSVVRKVKVIEKNTTTKTTTSSKTTTKTKTTTKATTKTTENINITTPPTITLNGSSTIEIYVGQAYKEPGYTAKDALGNDITANVNVSGIPNTNAVGTYTITYKVTDKNGNSTRKIRTVIVKSKAISVTSIRLVPNGASLNKGGTLQISATLSPSNATEGTSISWKSSNTSVATVSKNGVVTAKNTGTATITATTSNGKVATSVIQVK